MDFSDSKVLIVDDAKINLTMLESIITKNLKCQTILASNGSETFLVLKETIPDLIILDVMLPDTDGFEIAKKLKENSITKDIPIMFITSLNDEENKIKAFDAGGIDYLVKPFSSREVISRLAAQLRLKQQYEEINKMNKHILFEFSMARRIQNVIMPQREYSFKNLDIECKYIPYEFIGGDFYDVIEGEENIYFIFLIDVTGHGIPAALYTMMLKSNLYYLTQKFSTPAKILTQLNLDISKLLLDDFYPTALLLKIDLNTMTLQYANAGHPGPIFITNYQPVELTNRNFSLAIDPDVQIVEDQVQLKKGDRIFLYTDGLMEIQTKKKGYINKKFIFKYFQKNSSIALSDQLNGLIAEVKKESVKGFFEDDVTIVGIKIPEK